MTAKISKIPKFKNLEEEAKFWDTHDTTDYFDEMKDVKVRFNLNHPKDESVTIRLQPNLKQLIGKVARAQGLNSSTLLRVWVIEKLNKYRQAKTMYA